MAVMVAEQVQLNIHVEGTRRELSKHYVSPIRDVRVNPGQPVVFSCATLPGVTYLFPINICTCD